MSKAMFVLQPNPHPSRRLAAQAVQNAPDGMVVTIAEPTRNLEQNARLWASLAEVSKQVDWYGQHLTPEEWKDVFTACLERQKVVPGIEGGFVVCGQRTSKMSKRQFSNLLEVIYAFGAEKGVVFSDPIETDLGRTA
jgi:hypothetical protein